MAMERKKYLTTRILDTHGRIGPFFAKEFLFVFLATTGLFFLILLVSSFIPLPESLLIKAPVGFLLLVGFIRFFLIKKITSPWYIHQWVLHYFLKPHSIIANSLVVKRFKLCFPIRPGKRNQ
jgi:hypothetical protein